MKSISIFRRKSVSRVTKIHFLYNDLKSRETKDKQFYIFLFLFYSRNKSPSFATSKQLALDNECAEVKMFRERPPGSTGQRQFQHVI